MGNTTDWKYLLSFSVSTLLTIFAIITALVLVLYIIHKINAKASEKLKERELKGSNTATPLVGKTKK